jgi:hypothetical protein
MVRRISAVSIALLFMSSMAVQADDMGGESIPVPPPAVVVEEQEIVVIEEPVTAPPPAFVTLETKSVAAGIGLSWGEGILSFEGQRHAFSVLGVGVGDIGIAKLISEGAVSNLDDLADFEGTYVAVEAGAAAGLGASVLSMRNENGVVIALKSNIEGIQLALGAEGIRVTLN